MKKLFGILIVVVMMFGMLDSTKVFAGDAEFETADVEVAEVVDSEGVADVEEKINKIGEVDIHSWKRINEARMAYDELSDEQKELVENYSLLTDAESELLYLYEEVADTDHQRIYEETGQYIESLGTPGVGSVGGEWMVIDLTRSGRDCPEGYYENVVDYVNENINDKEQLHRAKSTENSRVILALTSAGYDVTDVDGHNLLKGLSDMNYLKKQGVNGPIWALIALDSYGYEIPENENEETQATREGIISYILEKQLSDGGWSIYGNVADPDMTGMAIQALAPYCNENSDVAIAVETALECLSTMQLENGSFGSIEGYCTESCAQVIVALTALGIDPENDERFLKNGISVVDALCVFSVEGGGFEHVPYGGLNGMATEQGQYALASYFRFLEGETFIYDMTDVTIENDNVFEDIGNDEEFEAAEDEEDEEELEVSDDEAYEEETSKKVEGGAGVPTASKKSQVDVAEKEKTYVEIEEIEIEEVEIEKPETITFTEDTFSDVKEKDWYFESVKYVFENNIMQGTDKAFEPESKVTRAMLVTVLYRMSKAVNVQRSYSFEDVPSAEWYSEAVAWAAENNIVKGVSEKKFAPDEYITREQMALIIYRYAKMQGIDVSLSSSLENYKDVNDVSDWAFDATMWANSAKLIKGTSDSALSPKDTATRAEVATILMRFCETVSK